MSQRFEPALDFARRNRTTILASGLCVALLSGVALTRVPFESDVLELIPQSGPRVGAFQLYVDRFDSLDFVYVLFDVSEGDAISEYDDLVEAYVRELAALPQIRYVDSAMFDSSRDWNYLLERLLLLLGSERAKDALATFESDGMSLALKRSRDALTIPSAAMRELVLQDPLGLVFELREKFANSESFVKFDPSQDGYVSVDGRSRLVIAKPTGRAFDAEFCKELLAALDDVQKKAIAAVREDIEPEDWEERPSITIEIAGAYRDTHEADSLIRREMKVNTAVSLSLILGLTYLVFRSQWILFCAATTLGLSGLLAMVAVGFWRGDLLAAASGGAAMLFGLGMDGIMLLYVRFLEERARGADVKTATKRLSPTVSSVLLGFITSVATFAALIFIDFPSLEELGRLVGLGMLLCAGLTLVFVPAVLGFQSKGVSSSRRMPHLPRLARAVEMAPVPIVGVAAGLTIVSLLALPRLEVVASLEKIQPRTPGATSEAKLQERFQFPENVLLVLSEGSDLDALLERHAALEQGLAARNVEASVSNALAFLPTGAEQKRVVDLVLERGLESPDVWTRLEDAATRAGFRPHVFEGYRERLDVLLDPEARITYDGLLEHGLGPFVSRFIARRAERYSAASYVYPENLADVASVAVAIEDLDPSSMVTGQALVNEELSASLLPQFLRGVLIGTVIVVLLIYFDFRSVRLTLWCLLPTILGLLWSAGVFALLGVELDLFSVFGVVMVIGIGVDYGIHVLHRYHHEGADALLHFLPWTGAALALAAVTTIIGFGTLAFSSYAPLGRLGVVSATSVMFVAFASLLVLPVLLRGKYTTGRRIIE